MRTIAAGSEGTRPKTSMKTPPLNAVAKSHEMRERWPKRDDRRSEKIPPEGLETMLRRPEMEARPPPTGWELRLFARKRKEKRGKKEKRERKKRGEFLDGCAGSKKKKSLETPKTSKPKKPKTKLTA